VPQANAKLAHREIRQAALRMIGLAVPENISHTSQGSNQRLLSFGVHLAAQAVDVDIDDVCIRLDSHSPNFIENHGSCDDAAGISAQVFQQNELLRRQVQCLSIAGRLPPEQIQFEIEYS
jgi:hypothetical protein